MVERPAHNGYDAGSNPVRTIFFISYIIFRKAVRILLNFKNRVINEK